MISEGQFATDERISTPYLYTGLLLGLLAHTDNGSDLHYRNKEELERQPSTLPTPTCPPHPKQNTNSNTLPLSLPQFLAPSLLSILPHALNRSLNRRCLPLLRWRRLHRILQDPHNRRFRARTALRFTRLWRLRRRRGLRRQRLYSSVTLVHAGSWSGSIDGANLGIADQCRR